MRRIEDNCVGCPPEMGCLGRGCPKRHELVFCCDECGSDADLLYQYNGKDWCEECLLEQFPSVYVDDMMEGDESYG